jgi:DNA-binding GntR family transcriptional regulator
MKPIRKIRISSQKSNEVLPNPARSGKTMPAKEISSTKDRIYRTIKEKIISLDLKPGDVLSDRRLSEELRVSRTPVREALNLLQKENFVRQQHGRGFCVSEISLKHIEDLYDVRIVLETAALRQAAKRDVTQQMENVEQVLKRHRGLVKNFRPKGTFLEDAEFHKAFVAMTENHYMFEILESILERIQMLRNIEGVSRERVKVALQQHSEIFECFRKRRYEDAEQLLCRHLEDSKENVLNRIKSRFQILYFENHPNHQ